MFDGNISIDEFDGWLSGFARDEKIGEARRCWTCPIANFVLSTKGPFTTLEVYEDQIFFKEEGQSDYKMYPLPQWAEHFIGAVDALVETKGDPISVGQAQDCLKPLKEQYATGVYL